jgi:AraC family transcriptional regulator
MPIMTQPDLLPPARLAGQVARGRAVAGANLIECTYGRGMHLRPHAHQHAHLCLVLEGEYVETVGPHARMRCASALVYLPAGCAHAEIHRTPGRHFIVELHPSVLEGAELLPKTDAAQLQDPAAALGAFRLYRSLDGASGCAGHEIGDAVVEVIGFASREGDTRGAAWLARARDALHACYRQPITLAELARDAGVHPVHLASVFRRAFGCSVGEYLRRLRLRDVCEAILRDADALGRIALDAGFADQSHMSRVFRRHMGMPPGAYAHAVRRRSSPPPHP